MVKFRRHVFGAGTYYLYEKVLDEDVEPLSIPSAYTYTFHKQSDLIKFHIYRGNALAHTTSIAFTNKAKQKIDVIPYKVNFNESEVCSGGSYTVPWYRNRGLYYLVYSHILHYLYANGYKADKASVNKNNKISIHVHEKLGFKRIGEGFYLNILGLRMWRENKVS